MMNIPQTHFDLLSNEMKAFLFLATLMPDGAPQVTPVWFSTNDNYIFINTAIGRVKDRNMRAHSQVEMCIQDPSNSYRYIQLRGNVVDFTTDGADEHIDSLALKYLGVAKYPNRQLGEQRVIFKIQVVKVDAHG
jgi:PPOX class probable F420-dependent enzyme